MKTLLNGLSDQLACALEGDGVGVDRLMIEPQDGTLRIRMTMSGLADGSNLVNEILDGDARLRRRLGRVFPGYTNLRELFRSERRPGGREWSRIVEFTVPVQEVVYLISVGYPNRSYLPARSRPSEETADVSCLGEGELDAEPSPLEPRAA